MAADERSTRVDAFVQTEMSRQKIPGLAASILSHGEVLEPKGYGPANVEHDVPVTIDILFQSGSAVRCRTSG